LVLIGIDWQHGGSTNTASMKLASTRQHIGTLLQSLQVLEVLKTPATAQPPLTPMPCSLRTSAS
jgi:hypothetical protein